MAKKIIDIYHGEGITSYDKVVAATSFVILKGSQGMDFVDNKCAERIKAFEERHHPYWVYVFLDKGDELAQTKRLVELYKDKVGKYFVGYIIDIERNNSQSGCLDALNYLLKLNHKCMFYINWSDVSVYPKLIAKRSDKCACWECRYGDTPGNKKGTDRSNKYPFHSFCDLAQFTEYGKCDGVSGAVDLNKVTGFGNKDLSWFTTPLSGTPKKEKKKAEPVVQNVSEKTISLIGHGSGNPSIKNMYEYLEKRYNQKASNGKRKSVVAVKRFKKLDESGRNGFITCIKQTIGRNIYSQNLRQYVYSKHDGKYYSDCSSILMATLQKLGWNVTLLNTAGIYNSSLFESVPVKIENGHITNPEILKPCDFLLFRGNDASRPLQIGHVEAVYTIDKGLKPDKTEKYSGELPKLPPRDYYKVGDGKTSCINYKNEIKLLQKFLNWCTPYNLVIDGIIGQNTRTAILSYQKQYGLVQDGLFGKKCLAQANKFK